MFSDSTSDQFRLFAKTLERALREVKTDVSQKKQVEGLVHLEREFRAQLCNHPAGLKVYDRFMAFILDERKNILSARPYFRERQRTFSSRISPALKIRSSEALQKFTFNFLFVKFAMSKYRGPNRKILKALAEQIRVERDALIQRNLPLAINRAKLFWKKIPKTGDREYMDFIQMCCEGLIAAIDKFVLPFRTVFRSVAIGRMVGNMTEASSDTLMHYYPSDKRLLYKANLLIHRKKLETLAEVVEEMNREKKSVIRATRRRVDFGLEVWVRELDRSGKVLDPRHRVDITFLEDDVRACFYDKKVGSKIKLPGSFSTFEILEMFEIVTEARLHGILKGSSHISMDAVAGGSPNVDSENTNLEIINVHSRIADPHPTPEDNLAQESFSAKIREAFDAELSVIERKVLSLQGAYYDHDSQ